MKKEYDFSKGKKNPYMPKAREILSQSDLIQLTRKESERFIAALQNPPKANAKLKQLFKKAY